MSQPKQAYFEIKGGQGINIFFFFALLLFLQKGKKRSGKKYPTSSRIIMSSR